MIWNALLLALRAIRRNVLRSFLTILGIVIGVAAVITMVSLGQGATAQVTKQISSLGSNVLSVRPGQRMGPGQPAGIAPLKLGDAVALGRDIDGITGVAPSSWSNTMAVSGNVNWSTTATGVDNEYFTVRNWPVMAGRAFSESEQRAGKTVCIIGATVRAQLFGEQYPLGAKIRLQRLSCQVIGVLQGKGQSAFGSDQDDVVLVPLRTYQRRIAGHQDIGVIHLAVREGLSTDEVKRDIERLMRERRRLAPGVDNNFRIMDTKEIAATLTGTTQVLTGLLGAVAAVSLLVGGIGIMNIMLVSVTERTREIGIRLAIGALEREVLLQFLVEAVALSSLGGLLGILLALISSAALASLMQVPFIFNPGIVALAFLFSAAVGVLFGYVPARKAARLDPIVALRHE